MRDNRPDVVEKSGFLNVDSQQLGQLIDNDHQTHARFEPCQDRLGNKIGEKAETQRTRRQKKRPDEE